MERQDTDKYSFSLSCHLFEPILFQECPTPITAVSWSAWSYRKPLLKQMKKTPRYSKLSYFVIYWKEPSKAPYYPTKQHLMLTCIYGRKNKCYSKRLSTTSTSHCALSPVLHIHLYLAWWLLFACILLPQNRFLPSIWLLTSSSWAVMHHSQNVWCCAP